MNHAMAKTMLAVLRFDCSNRKLAGPLAAISEEGWRRSLDWLDRSGLSLYFWNQIRQKDLWSSLPLAICSQLEKRRALNIERTRTMVQECKNLHNLFTSSGVRCVALKGFATVPDYCPDPALRVQFDHDWLIEKQSLDRAEELLRSAGYSRKKIRERDRAVFTTATSSVHEDWDPLQAYTAQLPRPVELHLELWDPAGEMVAIQFPQDCMVRSVTRTWEGQVFDSLNEEDALLFEALHAFRHIIHNWCRLSVLYEIAYFLHRRHAEHAFWANLLCRIERNFPLRQALGVVLSLAATLFGPADYLASSPEGSRSLSPNLQLWVDRFGAKSALSNFSSDKFSLFLLGEFVDRKQSWREIQRRRLFPIQIPRRIQGENAKEQLSALSQKTVCILRRIKFHLRGSLLYAWQFPQWRYLTWREEKRRLAHDRLSVMSRGLASTQCQRPGPVVEPRGMRFRTLKRG